MRFFNSKIKRRRRTSRIEKIEAFPQIAPAPVEEEPIKEITEKHFFEEKL